MIEPKFALSATVLLGFIGQVFNLVIPGAVGGDLIKAAFLVRMRTKKTQAVASMVIDRILGLLGMFVLVSIAGGFAWGNAPPNVQRLIMAAWDASPGQGVLALAAIFAQVFSRIFPYFKREHSRIGLIVSELHEMSATYRGRLDVVFACAGARHRQPLAHCAGVLPRLQDALPFHVHHPRPTLLGRPIDAFSMAVPLPFVGSRLHRGSERPAFQTRGT